MSNLAKQILNVFKLRIGVVIALTALTGYAMAPGAHAPAWKAALIGVAVLLSAAAAGAFNQYVERDIDIKMERTRNRPFLTGALRHGPQWLWLIAVMVGGSTLVTAWALNWISALYVFLGAFFYAVVYTVWLKRRTWLNIVIGGLAGSFAVMAGAAAVNPQPEPLTLSLAFVLFLWTPPHFWSLAIARVDDYQAARVPMLPVVIGVPAASRVVLANTIALVAASLLPMCFGAGPAYLAGALTGGAYFIDKSVRLARRPERKTAMVNFHASLLQLTVLIIGAIADAVWNA
ncbi:MAG TPA: heme o synthase [Noviherbaspirillum sp.]|uniref:heme o synthase n=1 Tax=Noviherbaspirillum sp. TaxID=1926288 RepID=UPI002B45E6CF|nr:heme o synthase [Noviherbaspirillum sp.]HJV84278.1 heme o synthase [Noviherbaspirillum sp.]